ncbi:MAG: outer-membrane lipoprotein carrier protein LolA [Gammaproteobacteria bacterium]|nr:outer-membrane lipoprotein carrier protein LolA [Gammaproteobacteria bacterium]
MRNLSSAWTQFSSSTLAGLVLGVGLSLSQYVFAESTEDEASSNSPSALPLYKQLEGYQSFSADFKLVSTDDRYEVLASQTGRVKFVRPDYFLWVVDPPDEQVISVQIKQVTVYDPLLEQVSYMNLADLSGADIHSILMDPSQLNSSQYSVSRAGSSYSIKSSSEQSLFNEINISFDGEVLRNIKVFDQLGGQSLFEFLNVEVNEPIDAEEFEVAIPDGVDVVGEKLSEQDELD